MYKFQLSSLMLHCVVWFSLSFCSDSDGQITAILDQKNYVEELNRHLRFVRMTVSPFTRFTVFELVNNMIFLFVFSASVNNLQAKVDALEKSNTKLTEEVRVMQRSTNKAFNKHFYFMMLSAVCFSAQLLVLFVYVYLYFFLSSQWQITGSSLYRKMWKE